MVIQSTQGYGTLGEKNQFFGFEFNLKCQFIYTHKVVGSFLLVFPRIMGVSKVFDWIWGNFSQTEVKRGL